MEPGVKCLRRLVNTKRSKEQSMFCHVVVETKSPTHQFSSQLDIFENCPTLVCPCAYQFNYSSQFSSSNTCDALVQIQSWVYITSKQSSSSLVWWMDFQQLTLLSFQGSAFPVGLCCCHLKLLSFGYIWPFLNYILFCPLFPCSWNTLELFFV